MIIATLIKVVRSWLAKRGQAGAQGVAASGTSRRG